MSGVVPEGLCTPVFMPSQPGDISAHYPGAVLSLSRVTLTGVASFATGAVTDCVICCLHCGCKKCVKKSILCWVCVC